LLQVLKDKRSNLARVETKALSQENAYFLPLTLLQLLQLRQQLPQAQLIAGATDVGLWINKKMMRFAQIIDLTQVAELQKIEFYPHHIAIGAGVSLNHAFAALVQQRPQLKAFFDRFAGHPVRNAGTMGGNIGNGSPIGDSMPVLIALGANLVLSRLNGKKIEHREIALDQLYTGYRTNILKTDEVISWIKVPAASTSGQLMQAYKISKRQEDDISAVCMALEIKLENQTIIKASMGLGGVAATPVRAHQTQAFLVGKQWSLETLQQASLCLQNEFQPISDMRASSQYRSHVLGALLQRFWHDHQSQIISQLSQL
jgi:xanthine dehydrogenase small subunit